MNRCFLPVLRALLALRTPAIAWGLTALLCASASAQAVLRTPPIPASAQPGLLQITQPPQALLNGQPVQLAPGARILGRDNLLLLSASLVGQQLPVRYRLDSLGLLHEVWVLSDAEIQAIPPR